MKNIVRNLGINLGTRLNITAHIRYITDKTKTVFNKLARISRTHWRIKYKNMNTYYKAVYIPIITYASPAWSDQLNVHHVRQLRASRRLALVRITKTYRTASMAAFQVLTPATPIEIAIQEKTVEHKLKKNESFT